MRHRRDTSINKRAWLSNKTDSQAAVFTTFDWRDVYAEVNITDGRNTITFTSPFDGGKASILSFQRELGVIIKALSELSETITAHYAGD